MSQPDLPTFSIDEIPFSYCGSWLNLSPIVGLHRRVDDVHLISHVTTMAPVLSVIPCQDGQRIPCRVEASPSQLTWTDLASKATVRATFDGPDTVRLRGTTLPVAIAAASTELTPFTGVFSVEDTIPNAVVFTMYETGRRYRVTVVRGEFDVVGAQQVATAERSIVIQAGPSGDWEVAIEQFETARAAYRSRDSFDEIVARVEQEFRSYLDAVAPWRSAETPAAGLAAYVMWSATVAPAGFLRREAVLMSKHWMDSVWSWDHCFNARALVGLPDLAWGQMLVPFDHQESFGALPDSVAHSRVLYNFVKPPIHGWMYTDLLAAGLPAPSGSALSDWYERLSRWTRFWLEQRRLPGHRLPFYQHGNDSGWDNSTAFDAARWIESPDLAAFLILQLDCLASLAVEVGQPEEASLWQGEAEVISAALLEELWDEGTLRFVVRQARTGAVHHSRSLLTVVPIVLGRRLPPVVLAALKEAALESLTEFGLATEPVDSVHYEDDGYWRGPIWAPSTFIVESGLRRSGEDELADVVSQRFRALCERFGFAENFDARTGHGLRDRAYTWTAGVYLSLAADHVRRATHPFAAVDGMGVALR